MGEAHAVATQVVTANSYLRGVSPAGPGDRDEIEMLENTLRSRFVFRLPRE
jgi:hypothetical protein